MPNLRYLSFDLSKATIRRVVPIEYWCVERADTEGSTLR